MNSRRWLENLLLVTGLLAIDIWIWSHAYPAIYQSWQNRAFERERDGASKSSPEVAAPQQASGPLGRLVIPRLRLRAMVAEGVGEDTLGVTLGHIPNTALPGQLGNVGVAGHRDTIFRALRDIRKHDLVVFETHGGRYTYRVEGTEIVKPDKVSVLNSSGTRELTLVTCYPFRYVGSAPDRFIVKARQIQTDGAPIAKVLRVGAHEKAEQRVDRKARSSSRRSYPPKRNAVRTRTRVRATL